MCIIGVIRVDLIKGETRVEFFFLCLVENLLLQLSFSSSSSLLTFRRRGPVGGLDHVFRPHVPRGVFIDHPADRGRHQHVAVDLQDIALVDRGAAGKVGELAPRRHVRPQRLDVEPRVVVRGPERVTHGHDAALFLLEELGGPGPDVAESLDRVGLVPEPASAGGLEHLSRGKDGPAPVFFRFGGFRGFRFVFLGG